MTSRPPLLTLLASLTIHGAALAVLFFLAGSEPVSSALVIDLAKLESATDEGGPKKERAGSARPMTRLAAVPSAPPSRSAPASSPSQVEAAPPAVAPPAPSSPEPPEPHQPAPARAAVAASEEALDGLTRSTTNSSAVEARPSFGASASRTDVASDGGVGHRATQGPSAAPGESSGGSGTGVALAPVGPPAEPGSEYGAYLAGVRRRIQESLQYPRAARRRGVKGTVHLEILIKPDGAISGVAVAASSSHSLLDDAALEAVRGLGRQPFPAGLLPRPLRVRLPVVFDLK